jgi:hypothetical protein
VYSAASTIQGHVLRAKMRASCERGAAIQISQIGIGSRLAIWNIVDGSMTRL